MSFHSLPVPPSSHLRSQSRASSLADSRGDTAVPSHYPRLVSHVPSSRPSSSLGLSEQGVQAAAGASHPLALGNALGSQNSARCPSVGRVPDDCDNQRSWPVNQIAFATPPSPQVPKPSVLPSQLRPPLLPLRTRLRPPPPPPLPPRIRPVRPPPPPPPVSSGSLPYRHVTSLKQSLNSQHVMQPSWQYSQQSQGGNPGMFNQAQGFTATGAFVDGNVGTVNINTSNLFMKELLRETIPGAAFDSSARYPPPRCHPGTRLAILAQCLLFVANCKGEKKMRWVVGAAGVGKSAIMQSVAESPELPVGCHASVFFSINGRDDGTKAIITISYQLAAKSELYCQVIENEIARDPSLLQSSMPSQFKKLIAEPFTDHPQLSSVDRVLIIIDGLDECSDPLTQQELLCLISDFCIKHPKSPLVWLIASRPETHITSFFSRDEIMLVYEKEEILVDSNEAREDVERFLRAELTKIKTVWGLPGSQWPKEEDFWKIAGASGGLFAYAHTVVRYIGDTKIGSPVLQLSDVLGVIDEHPIADLSREEHPMALLDALYARILSKVPPKIMIHTRKLLLALVSNWDRDVGWLTGTRVTFVVLCNWLGMTPDEAYAALNHLHSVFRVPRRDEADDQNLQPFHKSFIDYVSDFSRSDFFPNVHRERRQLMTQCAFRILEEAPDGIDLGNGSYQFKYGTLTRGPGTGNKIPLTWLDDEEVSWHDNEIRLGMYKLAMGEVIAGMGRRDPTFLNVSCFRLLATQFQRYTYGFFPHNEMCDSLFDDSRRNEFMTQGLLQHMPLKMVHTSVIFDEIKLRFRRPAATAFKFCDPWSPSCVHKWEGEEWEEGKDIDWTTNLRDDSCGFCLERFQRQLKSWKLSFPEHAVTSLFTSATDCCVEVRFVDFKDGMSEWTYWFWFMLSLEERKEYGISV